MMRALINDPEHWYLRAEEARSIAEEMTDAQARQAMLQVADSYERLGKRAEARTLSNGNQAVLPDGGRTTAEREAKTKAPPGT